MSCCHASVPQEVRPGTARVLVTELSGSGHINPTPATKPCDDSETAVEPYLSPEKLVGLQKWPRIQSVFNPLMHTFPLLVVVVCSCGWYMCIKSRPQVNFCYFIRHFNLQVVCDDFALRDHIANVNIEIMFNIYSTNF